MVKWDHKTFSTLPIVEQQVELQHINQQLADYSAIQRVEWSLLHLSGEFILSSSFGIQAAVCLHLITQQQPTIPVILIDTGYLFPETYQFIDQLTQQLQLNLRVYRAALSPAWQEARYGQLWTQGLKGIEQYNQLNKAEPMTQALQQEKAGTWFAGLRRQQSASRQQLPILARQQEVFKVLPIVDWDNRQVHHYLTQHQLPYHPLWEQGYVSVGDKQTTRRWELGMLEEETRFFGLKRECGLHEA